MFPKVIFIVVSLALLVIFCLGLIRALLGPTVFDRIVATNMIGTKTVLFIAVIGFLMGRPDFLDIALLYALINFVGLIAILQFIKANTETSPAPESPSTPLQNTQQQEANQ